jgi:hypothetical protein
LADPGYSIEPDYSTENTILHVLVGTAIKAIQHDNKFWIFDDELWVIHGADSVYVLRKESHGEYSLVGEALIFEIPGRKTSKIMYGAMARLDERGSIQAEEISII